LKILSASLLSYSTGENSLENAQKFITEGLDFPSQAKDCFPELKKKRVGIFLLRMDLSE
jgi:hypothetical protein